MSRLFLICTLAALAAGHAPAQPATAAPAFEVATIKPAGPPTVETASDIGIHVDGAQFRALLALKDYLGAAYRVKTYQISGPDWITSERYEIKATLPAGSSMAQVPEMLRELLVDRFQIKTHREKKDLPVYALEVAKSGFKLQESPPAEGSEDKGKPAVNVGVAASGQGVSVNLGHGSSYTFANNRFTGTRLTMANLTGNLERFLDRPVVDMTNLTGRYDFALDLTEEDYRSMLIRSAVLAGIALPPAALRLLDTGAPISLFSAIEKLGLRLDARKAPLDVVVIDDLKKTPTDN